MTTYEGVSTAPELQVSGQISDHFELTTVPYITAVPLMYLIGGYVHAKKLLGVRPRTNCLLVDGISRNSRRMKEGAAKWPALHTCYNFSTGEGPTVFHRHIDTWWMNIRNAQAVRNRLKIAKHELRAAIRTLLKTQHTVRILSLAAGTAQGVIEVASEFKKQGADIRIMLVDIDASALRHAQELARMHGVEISTAEGNVLKFTQYIDGFDADIVEMMGLVDYLRDSLAIALMRKIRRYLKIGGYFFTCHIHDNSERYFLKHVVDWDMLYRTPNELRHLVTEGGFKEVRLVTEPHGIHSVAVARKSDQ